MIQKKYFSKINGITLELQSIIDCFEKISFNIDSTVYKPSKPNVLEFLDPGLNELNFKKDKTHILSNDGKILIDVEAGRANENNEYTKVVFNACLEYDAEYLVIAVPNTYKINKSPTKPFEKIEQFFEALYKSNRLNLPIKGTLLIGY